MPETLQEELTANEIKYLIFLTKNRLRYEARRPSNPKPGGRDIQSVKVWELSNIVDKLERKLLAQ